MYRHTSIRGQEHRYYFPWVCRSPFTMFEYDFSRLDVAEVNVKDQREDENEIVAGFVVISRRK